MLFFIAFPTLKKKASGLENKTNSKISENIKLVCDDRPRFSFIEEQNVVNLGLEVDSGLKNSEMLKDERKKPAKLNAKKQSEGSKKNKAIFFPKTPMLRRIRSLAERQLELLNDNVYFIQKLIKGPQGNKIAKGSVVRTFLI